MSTLADLSLKFVNPIRYPGSISNFHDNIATFVPDQQNFLCAKPVKLSSNSTLYLQAKYPVSNQIQANRNGYIKFKSHRPHYQWSFYSHCN